MEKYVCENCFEDYAIANFVRENATENKCDYCGTDSDEEPIAADLDDVARFIREGLETEWADPDDEGVPWDNEEDEYIVPVHTTDELLENVVNARGLASDLASKIGGSENWCQRDAARLTKHDEWYFDWENFSEQLKHHSRFVFYKINKESEGYGTNAYEILDEVGELALQHDLIRTIPIGTKIVRARSHWEMDNYSQVEELGPPPKESAVANRMSPAGIVMLYGSRSDDTALNEIADNKPFATLADFTTLRTINVLDLTIIPKVPSVYDQENGHLRSPLIFLSNFLSDLTEPVEKDGHEHIDYVPTQVVTEYFRHIFRDSDDQPLQGIVFPSSRHENGVSYVFFFNAENCTQDDRDNAESDLWLSMKSKSVRRVDLRIRPAPPPDGRLL